MAVQSGFRACFDGLGFSIGLLYAKVLFAGLTYGVQGASPPLATENP